MKHQSRILSLILCAALLMSSIVFPVSAETKIVKKVHLYADVPYAGRTADFTAKTGTDAKEQGYKLYFRYPDNDGGYNAVKWYDNTAKKALNPGDCFIKGHEYTQSIAISTDYGYEFPYTRSSQNGVTNWSHNFDEITLNSEDVMPYHIDTNGYRERLYVSRTYPPCTDAPAGATIDTVAVKDLEYPMAGNTPDYDVMTTGDFYGLHDNDAYAISWYAVKGEFLISLDSEDVFTVGTTYRVDVTLKANYGYRFKYDNPDTPNMQSATINGVRADYSNAYNYVRPVPERELKISYTFPPCPGDVVSQIEITGVIPPEVGENPSYEAVMLADAYVLSGYEDSKNKNGINWYDKTAGDFLRPSDTFVEGHEYTVSFELFISEGYRFDKGNVTATVNGYNADVQYYSEGDTKHYVEYTFEPCFGGEYIPSLHITDVIPPVPDENPSMSYSIAESECIVGEAIWVNMTDESFVGPTDAFIEGRIYRLYMSVWITDSDAYRFADQLEVTVNGKTADIDILDNNYVIFWCEFPPCGLEPGYTPGDANRDGSVNLTDVTVMLQYVAKWAVDIDRNAADVDPDGAVNLNDVTLMLKYIAKWDVVLG